MKRAYFIPPLLIFFLFSFSGSAARAAGGLAIQLRDPDRGEDNKNDYQRSLGTNESKVTIVNIALPKKVKDNPNRYRQYTCNLQLDADGHAVQTGCYDQAVSKENDEPYHLSGLVYEVSPSHPPSRTGIEGIYRVQRRIISKTDPNESYIAEDSIIFDTSKPQPSVSLYKRNKDGDWILTDRILEGTQSILVAIGPKEGRSTTDPPLGPASVHNETDEGHWPPSEPHAFRLLVIKASDWNSYENQDTGWLNWSVSNSGIQKFVVNVSNMTRGNFKITAKVDDHAGNVGIASALLCVYKWIESECDSPSPSTPQPPVFSGGGEYCLACFFGELEKCPIYSKNFCAVAEGDLSGRCISEALDKPRRDVNKICGGDSLIERSLKRRCEELRKKRKIWLPLVGYGNAFVYRGGCGRGDGNGKDDGGKGGGGSSRGGGGSSGGNGGNNTGQSRGFFRQFLDSIRQPQQNENNRNGFGGSGGDGDSSSNNTNQPAGPESENSDNRLPLLRKFLNALLGASVGRLLK